MAVPKRIGPYVIERQLGEGGMGAVYQARSTETGGRYALKVLASGADAELRMRFEREGEAHARVDGHANVVRIHSAGVDRDQVYLVMDLVEGGDLEATLRAGALEPERAVRLVRDLARGLAHLHAQGVLHRDLKPANVLLAEDGTPQLADFGLAQLAGADSLTESGAILGTPTYMAPEQVESREEQPTTDVYGLGAVLYHALTGFPPYRGASPLAVMAKIAHGPPPRPRSLRPELPAALDAICAKAMAARMQDRYPSAEAFADDLDRFLAGEAISARRPGRARVAVALVAIGAVALTGGLIATARPPSAGGRADPKTQPRGLAPPDPTERAAVKDDPLTSPATDPVDWAKVIAAARGAVRNKDPSRAAGILNRALAANPGAKNWGRSTALLIRAEAYRLLGRDELARADYARSLAENPRQVSALAKRARMNFTERRYEEALSDWALAEATNATILPSDPVANRLTNDDLFKLHSDRAVAWGHTRRLPREQREDLAWDDWGRALAIRFDPNLLLARTRASRKGKRYSRMNRDLLVLIPYYEGGGKPEREQRTEAYLLRAWAHVNLGDLWTAREDLARALERGARGEAVVKIERKIGAFTVGEDHLTSLEAFAKGLDVTRSARARLGFLTRATLEKLCADLLVARAWVLRELKRELDAKDDLRWALELEPNHSGALELKQTLGW